MFARKILFLLSFAIFNASILFLCCSNILNVPIVISVVFLVLFFIFKKDIFIFIFVFSFSLFLSFNILSWSNKELCYKNGELISAKARVIRVEQREGYNLVKLRLYDNCNTVVFVRDFDKEEYDVSDILYIKASLYKPVNFSPRFDYENYLKSKGVLAIANLHYVNILKKDKDIYYYLDQFKKTYVETLYTHLPAKNASLALGITIGEKNALSKEDVKDFINSSLIHIVVFSGYNMMLFTIFVFSVLFFLPLNIRVSLSVLSIFLFTIIVGQDAPTTRAGIMAAISFLALALGKELQAISLLLLSFIIMFMISPFSVLYDPGFQMSFAITAGLILFTHKLKEFLFFIPKYLNELVSSSLVASILAAPFTIYYMQQVQIFGFIANLLVLPIVPLSMIVTLLIYVFSFFTEFVAHFLSLINIILLDYIFFIAKTFNNYFPLVELKMNSFHLVLIVYLLFFFIYKNISRNAGDV